MESKNRARKIDNGERRVGRKKRKVVERVFEAFPEVEDLILEDENLELGMSSKHSSNSKKLVFFFFLKIMLNSKTLGRRFSSLHVNDVRERPPF